MKLYSRLGHAYSARGGGNVAPLKRDEIQFLCLSLRGWCLLVGLLYFVSGVAVLVLYFVQHAGVMSLNRVSMPVTQALVLEVANVQRSWPQQVGGGSGSFLLGDRAELGSSCSLLEGSDVLSSSSGVSFLKPLVLNYGTLDVRVCLLAILFVSALFTLADCFDPDAYYLPLERGLCHLSHYVEGSFSFPLMVLILCVTVGITDLMTLLGAACNAWCCMVFAQLAEVLSQNGDGIVHFGGIKTFEYHVIAHFAHWIAFICSISVYMSNLTVRGTCVVSRDAMSGHEIVGMLAAYVSVVLFALFGAVQSYVLYVRAYEFGNGNGNDSLPPEMKIVAAFNAEFATLILGLVVRLFLCVLVYVGAAVS